jgi:ABC-type transport system substrate-binding protein
MRTNRSKGRRLLLSLCTTALVASVVVAPSSGERAREGGTFLIAGTLDAIDPATAIDAAGVLHATCAQLMSYPDRPLTRVTHVVPEVAAREPVISKDGRTYTFSIRKGFRFNTGEGVTAASFSRAIDRVLNPAMKSPSVQSVIDIVGSQAVLDGKATHASGVTARANTLTVRLKRAAGDFTSRVATFPFCAVPTDLPIDPEGIGAPFPGAGPYYVAAFVPGESFVLKRNPYYRGSRPHHVDEFDASVAADPVAAIKASQADWADLGPLDLVGLEPRYRPQVHLLSGMTIRFVTLNSARPLFKDNVALRQAVNFAIDRAALIAARGGPSTGPPNDQYLMPAMPGFDDARIYPLARPDLARAKALAKGHTRGGKATLYIKDSPVDIAQGQILQRDLKPIGITVVVKKFPGPQLFQQLFTPGSHYDMALNGIGVDYLDPYGMLNVLFDGRLIGTPVSFNLAHFDSPEYNAKLTAASKLTGAARFVAYGKLDVDLVRNAAPVAAYQTESAATFVSSRVGCVVVNPYLDLAAVCLK